MSLTVNFQETLMQAIHTVLIYPKLPPVDVNLKFRPDCKAHVMELYPDLFDGVGTIQMVPEVKLDVDPSMYHQWCNLQGRFHSATIEPLKKEIDQMLELKVI